MSRHVTRPVLAALAILAASSAVASAQGYRFDNGGSDIDRRQDNQQRRIQEGMRDGSITRREAYGLQQEQARIADLERRAKADGRVDGREAAGIRGAQNEASRHIYQERHDSEQRRSWGWRRWW